MREGDNMEIGILPRQVENGLCRMRAEAAAGGLRFGSACPRAGASGAVDALDVSEAAACRRAIARRKTTEARYHGSGLA